MQFILHVFLYYEDQYFNSVSKNNRHFFFKALWDLRGTLQVSYKWLSVSIWKYSVKYSEIQRE